jgi:hypothetical protein
MARNRCFSYTFCLSPSNVRLFFNSGSSVEIGSGNTQENTFMASAGVVRRVDEPSSPAGKDSPVPVDFRLQMDSHDKGKERTGKVPEEARKAIMRAGLSLRAPFKAHSVHQI